MIGVLANYLPLLLATLVIELAIARAFVAGTHLVRSVRRRTLLVCIAANLLTHPVVTLWTWQVPIAWLPLEILALLVELFVYLRIVPLHAGRAVLIAVCANFATAALALVLSLG